MKQNRGPWLYLCTIHRRSTVCHQCQYTTKHQYIKHHQTPSTTSNDNNNSAGVRSCLVTELSTACFCHNDNRSNTITHSCSIQQKPNQNVPETDPDLNSNRQSKKALVLILLAIVIQQ
jgi:hypothetical protein